MNENQFKWFFTFVLFVVLVFWIVVAVVGFHFLAKVW